MPKPPWPSTRSSTYQCRRDSAGSASGNTTSAMTLASVSCVLLREPGDVAYPLGHDSLPPPGRCFSPQKLPGRRDDCMSVPGVASARSSSTGGVLCGLEEADGSVQAPSELCD